VLDTNGACPKGARLATPEVLRNLPARLGRRHLHGWGDLYGSRVSGQELDISTLSDGAYCLSRAPTPRAAS